MVEDDKKLNLGCGLKKIDNYINLDNRESCNPDVVHDLNNFPYPFSDNSFSEIVLDHVIEHLDDPLKVLSELYRLAKPNAIIFINCPHFSCNWVHPGHKSAISVHLFDFLDKNNEEVYANTYFIVESVSLRWSRYLKGKKSFFLFKILNYIINSLANISPSVTERVWCYWVGGFEEIRFRVRVLK